jgi:hypothetical protein
MPTRHQGSLREGGKTLAESGASPMRVASPRPCFCDLCYIHDTGTAGPKPTPGTPDPLEGLSPVRWFGDSHKAPASALIR